MKVALPKAECKQSEKVSTNRTKPYLYVFTHIFVAVNSLAFEAVSPG